MVVAEKEERAIGLINIFRLTVAFFENNTQNSCCLINSGFHTIHVPFYYDLNFRLKV